jgi:mRNA-degrading endonuclease toxin of MazEF toxin-antitoxin module
MTHEKNVRMDCYALCDLLQTARKAQMNDDDVRTIAWVSCEHVLARELCVESIVERLTETVTILTDEIYACHLSAVAVTPLIDGVKRLVSEIQSRLLEQVDPDVHWNVKDLQLCHDMQLHLRLEGWVDPRDQPVVLHT